MPIPSASVEDRRRGFWLRMARERANLSQPAAAALLGLSDKSASTLSAWESGTREPSPSKLKAMAELYAVPVALFYAPPPTAIEQMDAIVAGEDISRTAGLSPDLAEAARLLIERLEGTQPPDAANSHAAHGSQDRDD